MRNIREVARLAIDCRLTNRQIATSCSIVWSTVTEYLRRFSASGLSWSLSPATDARNWYSSCSRRLPS